MLDFSFATPPEICRELGTRLRRQRLAQDMSQLELAERADVAVGTIKRIEQDGQATLESWVKALMALGAVDTLQPVLLASKPKSIAQMEREAQPERIRASRRRVQ